MAKAWIERSRLWLVLDRKAAEPRSLPDVAAEACAAGIDVILCRIKDEPIAFVEKVSRAVRSVCLDAGVPFVMSHYPQLALELKADGVQIGVADCSIAQVRELLGVSMAVGYSCHGIAEAAEQLTSGADYVFLGPIFATPEKLKYGNPLGLEAVEQGRGLNGPVVFIGGISSLNVEQVTARGGKRVAAISALQRVNSIAEAVRQFKAFLPP